MSKFTPELEAEIAERIAIFNGEDADVRGGETLTRADVLKEMIQDMDDDESVAYAFKRELEDFGARIGIFKAHDKAALDRIQVSGRRKKYDFKRGDVFYVFDSWEPLAKATGE